MFAEMQANGIDFARHWLSEWGVFGFDCPWRQTDYGGTAGLPPIEIANTLPGREVAFRLSTTPGYGKTRFMFLGWMTKPPACRPDTQYRVSCKYLLPQDLVARDPSKSHGLDVKAAPGWLGEPAQVVDRAYGTPWGLHASAATSGWQEYVATYHTGPDEYFLPWVYVASKMAAQNGKDLYLDGISIQQVGEDGALRAGYPPQRSSRHAHLLLPEAVCRV